MSYNVKFELSVGDVELIETALLHTQQELSSQIIGIDAGSDIIAPADPEMDDSVRQIHDLLGRLHNQKVFYRPRSGAYIGG